MSLYKVNRYPGFLGMLGFSNPIDPDSSVCIARSGEHLFLLDEEKQLYLFECGTIAYLLTQIGLDKV